MDARIVQLRCEDEFPVPFPVSRRVHATLVRSTKSTARVEKRFARMRSQRRVDATANQFSPQR
jgi:hypothetical protein